MDQQHVVDSLGYESKGIVRMSTKQLKTLETTLAGALRREQMAETSIKQLELLQFFDGNAKQCIDPKSNMQPKEDICSSEENNSPHLEVALCKNTLDELEECRCRLNSCLEENVKLSRELDDLRSMLENIRSEPNERDAIVNITKEAALNLGGLTSEEFDTLVVPEKMIGPSD
nr:kinesin-like protein kin-12d [Quercus suber]